MQREIYNFELLHYKKRVLINNQPKLGKNNRIKPKNMETEDIKKKLTKLKHTIEKNNKANRWSL